MKARNKKWLLGGLLALGAVWYLWPKSAQATSRRAQTGSGATLIPSDMVSKLAPPKVEPMIQIGNDNNKLINLMMLKKEVGRLDALAGLNWGHGRKPLTQPK